MSEIVLSGKQRKALEALLQGQTMTGAAGAAGVTPRTVTRWRDDPAFVAALAAGQRELLASTLRALEALARSAVVLLGKTILDSEARPGDRLRAAGLVLDHVLPLAELVDLEARIAALEAKQDAQ